MSGEGREELIRARFAPSPTGDLHLGGALVALASFVRARATDGAFVVRVEDLDPPRVVEGATERILDDLEWLGLAWDEGPRVGGAYAPYEQSARGAIYERALEALRAQGLVYACTCSRAEIARAASAPHPGEEGPRYPGTCRGGERHPGRPAALRLRVPDDARRIVAFDDLFRGPQQQDVAEHVGDFVLRRADGVWAYQLAVAVDDGAMRIDEVVRGDDLLTSTARQLLIQRLLGLPSPRYGHVPLVRGPDGERLAKRHQASLRGSTIAELRDDGVEARAIVGELGHALGLLDEARATSLDALIGVARSRVIAPRQWSPEAPWLRARASVRDGT